MVGGVYSARGKSFFGSVVLVAACGWVGLVSGSDETVVET